MKHDWLGWIYKYGFYRIMMGLNPEKVLRPSVAGLVGKKNLIGIEIGVRAGGNAKVMLDSLDIETLYLIDPYEMYYENGRFINEGKYLSQMKRRLSRYGKKVVFIKQKSSEALKYIANPVDFVYIDGCHVHPVVDDDIRIYYDIVEKGGIFGGHDFNSDYPDVMEAVFDFVHKKKLRLYVKNDDWWVIKK